MREENNPNLIETAEKCLINATDNSNLIISKIAFYTDRMPEEDVCPTVNYLFSLCNDYKVLNYLLKMMNEIKSPSSVPVLVDTLLSKKNTLAKIKEEDIIVQLKVNIINVLANIKDSSAVNSLLYCLNNKHENYKVRLNCAEALGKIGDRFAVMPLTEIIKDENEKSIYIKESVAFALGLIGDAGAVETLVKVLETKKKLETGLSFLKEKVIESLSKLNIKNDRVFNALKNAVFDDSEQVRINAVEALYNLGDERVVNVLYDAVKDNSDEVVRTALIALYNLTDKNSVIELRYAETSSKRLKRIAEEILKEIEDAEE